MTCCIAFHVEVQPPEGGLTNPSALLCEAVRSISKDRQDVRDLLEWNPRPVSAGILESAWEIEDRWKLSWWDSLIAASALDCGTTILLSEDMQNGLVIHSLQILDPFSKKFDMEQLSTL